MVILPNGLHQFDFVEVVCESEDAALSISSSPQSSVSQSPTGVGLDRPIWVVYKSSAVAVPPDATPSAQQQVPAAPRSPSDVTMDSTRCMLADFFFIRIILQLGQNFGNFDDAPRFVNSIIS